MNNSYRVQAERRASLSRTSASRAYARPPLELPPWGYGSGRLVSSMPMTTISAIGRRPKRSRTRSVSPTKQQSNGNCETGPTQTACSRPNAVNTGPPNYPNSITHHRKAAEHGLDACASTDPVMDVEAHHHYHRMTGNHRSTTAGDSVAEKCAAVSLHEHKRLDDDAKNVGSTADTVVPTQDPCTLEEGVDSMGDMPVLGGGPVTSSSMETWTTYDTSTSPRGGLQSAASSPHSIVVAPRANQGEVSSTHIPLTPDTGPQSAASSSHGLLTSVSSSPHGLLTSAASSPHGLLTSAASSQHSVLTPLSPAFDSSPPQSATSWLRRISPTALTTNAPPLDANPANNTADSTSSALPSPSPPATDVKTTFVTLTAPSEPLTQEVPKSPPASSERSPKQKTVTSSVANDDSASCEVTADRPDSSKSDKNGQELSKSEVSPKTNLPKSPEWTDENKSNLMVGLVKVKSRHTGLMIDCPILETVYQNETASSPTAVRQRSSHKVVLIKAVVPRWAWNSPNSSSRASLSSAKTTDRELKVSKRKSSVSVNTQTSETLLLTVRRTTSEHQTSPISSKPSVDTLKYVPARRDDCRLTPSPKHSRCRSTERSAATPVESRASASPNNASHRILPEESNSPTAPICFGSMQEEPKESGSQKQSSLSMEYDVLTADTIETLKLDLQFSSSGNNSESDSVPRGNIAVKSLTAERVTRGSSSSSEIDTEQRRPSCPTFNWSCAAAAAKVAAVAKASADAINSFKTFGYVDERAMSMMQSPPQKTTPTVGSAHSPPSQGRSTASYKDNYCKSRTKSKSPPSANSSQTNEIKASPRPIRSPCLWRPLSHNNVMDFWQELDFTGQDPHYYKQKQRHQTATSRSESSLSDRSKSRFHNHYYVAPIKVSPLVSSNSSKSRHSEQNSIGQQGYLAASGVSDACATDPVVDVDTHHRHSNYRSTISGNVESTPHRSRHNHHKHRTAEKKLQTQERHKTSTYTAKRSYEKQHKWNAEAARCGDVALSARSNGSSIVSRNAQIPKPSSKRHHSSSASRHGTAGTYHTEKCNASTDQSAMSRGQHCSVGDNKHRSRTQHPDRPSTPSGRRQRHGNRVVKASMSRSTESLLRRRVRQPPVHANYSATIGEQSKSTQPKRQSRRHDDRQSKETFYECRQPIVYRSPRSLKPFPPPISDRYQTSPFDNSSTAAVGSPSDAESFKYSFVQNESDFADASKGYQLPHRQERPRHHKRPVQTNIDDQRHVHAAALKPSNGTRRHHRKLPVTPPSMEPRSAMPSLTERPAWKRY